MSQFQSIRKAAGLEDNSFEKGASSDRFESIKHLHPRFAFDFISMESTPFCYNSKLLGVRDYHKLMRGLKDISSQTYEVINKEERFHFHDIDWNDVTVSKSDFIKCIYRERDSGTGDEITAYQFKVFEKARVLGFIYKGIFYLVMLDRGHNAYKRKDNKKR